MYLGIPLRVYLCLFSFTMGVCVTFVKGLTLSLHSIVLVLSNNRMFSILHGFIAVLMWLYSSTCCDSYFQKPTCILTLLN